MSANPKYCALCSTPITVENDSAEHIIPNAIGGRKKVSGFICRPCNSQSGNDGEAELAKQLNWWSLAAGVKRERGEVPAMEVGMVDGGKVRIKSDGSLESTETNLEKEPLGNGQYSLHITAPNMDRVEQMLKGLKRKHPEADLDAIRNQVDWKTSDIPILSVENAFGGLAVGRSAIKSACALAAHHGLDVADYELSAQFLRNECVGRTFNWFYERDLVGNRPSEHLFHCVSIQSDTKKQLLLGYVEYFGCHRIVALLSEKYAGKDVSVTYAINPSEGQEIDLVVDLNLSNDELQQIRDGRPPSKVTYETALNYALRIAMHISKKQDLERELGNALDTTFQALELKEGQVMSKELAEAITNRLLQEMDPYFARLIRR